MLQRRLPRLAAAAAALLLGACAVPLAAGGTAGPLVSSLQVEPEPQRVLLRLQVTNASAEPVTLTFPTGQLYDFAVRDDARERWRWSADRGFTQAVRTETLAAGETRTFEEAWPRPDGASGRFTAEARLASSSHPLVQTSQFQLP